LEKYLTSIKNINSIENAIDALNNAIEITPKISKAIPFCIEAHKNQYRKSGEPYVVHPILVAAITGHYSNDESMVLAALLHDVVEDTSYTLDDIKEMFGLDVANIVDGLTKITEIRVHELTSSKEKDKLLKSAMTFRKMLVASIEDVRVLLVKLFDRTHNMLTLDALSEEKRFRIAEETLVVYAPIAHRLGMSAIKNTLEDLSFFYIYPNEYKKIDEYIKNYQDKIQNTFNLFIADVNNVLKDDFRDNIKIYSRIKHYYSIFLKIQRKGVTIDEVLDLLAIRIITDTPLECYKVLGHMHTTYMPLISRFKDYIAIPKENGYQTIHTTVFHNTKIFEIQIRTRDMDKIAEFGVAAHWKYKNGHSNFKEPNLKWLHTLEMDNENVEEFYDETKKELFYEEIIVYSPKGEIFKMPRGSCAYDFAYMIHTDLGNKAIDCFVNKVKKPLITELRSGDIVSINKGEDIVVRCSWINIVKTTKAKKGIKVLCQNRHKQIDIINGKNIVNTIFSRYTNNILEKYPQPKVYKVVENLDHLKHLKKMIETTVRSELGLFARMKVQQVNLKEYKFENLVFYSNFSLTSFSFDHCCHPKLNDEIVAFRDGRDAVVHHKMCENAYILMKQKHQMVFCRWSDDKYYVYKMVVSLKNIKGELARLLIHLSNHDATILFIEYGKDRNSHIQYCTIDLEIKNNNSEKIKKIVNQKAKIIEFYSGDDAYK
jgi:GTP pyrophosphokinase